ncbi:hypothetical protein GEMRC1_009007 [Eukaryota sp. GEM-RC1]
MRLRENCESLAVKLSESIGREKKLGIEKLLSQERFFKPMEVAFMGFYDVDAVSVQKSMDHSRALLADVNQSINLILMEKNELESLLREIFEDQAATSDFISSVVEQQKVKISEIIENRDLREHVLEEISLEVDTLEEMIGEVTNELYHLHYRKINKFPNQDELQSELNHLTSSLSDRKYDLDQAKSKLITLNDQLNVVSQDKSKLAAQKTSIEEQIFEKLKLTREHESKLAELEESFGIEVRMAVKEVENQRQNSLNDEKLSLKEKLFLL